MKPASTIAWYSRLHHVGEREDVVLVALVIIVLQVARDLPGRGRGHEDVLALGAGDRLLGDVDIGLRRRPVLPADRAVAGRAVLERRGEVLEDLGELGEFRFAGAHRRRAFALVAGQTLEHMHGVVGAALLAVIDDVDAAFDLLLHDELTASRTAAFSSAWRAPGFLSSASSSSTTFAVRGRLPVWVVRMRFELLRGPRTWDRVRIRARLR